MCKFWFTIKAEKGFAMKQENKIFGILAIILGAIALLGSWIPGINQISFLIAILALILGIVGLFINRKNKKVLAIIGTILSVASIVFAVGSQVIYNQIQKNAVQNAASTNQSEEEFTWTKEQFDALKQGDILKQGAGGTNYEDVIKEHGKPSKESTTKKKDRENKVVSYVAPGNNIKSVTLTFDKQEDGSYLLISKVSMGLE